MSYRTRLALASLLIAIIASPAAGQWISPPGSITYTFDKIGIGTNNPVTDLHVVTDQSGGPFLASGMRVENLNPAANGERTVVLSLKNNHSSSPQDWLFSVIGNSPGRSGNFEIRQIGGGVPNVNRLTITPSGNVGLGTVSPAEKLEVNGTVKAREVVVTQQGWPDFVFADDYVLQPLAELEAEIAELGHLPGIPSAAEVEQDGIGLGEMQAMLLRKVEELTLHMIALGKENRALRERLDRQAALRPAGSEEEAR